MRFVTFFVLAMGAASPALAQHAYQNLSATPIVVRPATFQTGVPHQIELTGLSAGAGVTMHLWHPASASEDSFGQTTSGALSVPFTNLKGDPDFVLIVRATETVTGGTGTLRIRRHGKVVSTTPVAFGGAKVAIDSGPGHVLQTATPPGGLEDPVVLALTNHGHLISFDDDGGVGRSAAAPAPNGTPFAMVAAKGPAPDFRVHLYVNDTLTDLFPGGDGDGLGTQLEQALGLCPNPQCGANPVVYGQDSDRDGLPDGEELLGVDSATNPQLLPFWGANPQHKDVFVEVDVRDPHTEVELDDEDLEWLRDRFAEGPAAHLQNPDGIDGVSLHLDIGRDPTDAAHAGLFGDWGGSEVVPSALTRHEAAGTRRAGIRMNRFRYLLQRECSKPGGQGDRAGQTAEWGACDGNGKPRTFLHELGHTLNLDHFGHELFGAVNCKPNYRSQMNYLFHGDEDVGFSTGTHVAALNPASARESLGLGTGADITYVGQPPLSRLLVPPTGVDWDFSQDIASALIRAPLTFASGNHGCETFIHNVQNLVRAPIETAPALAQWRDDRLYAFYAHSGQLWVTWSEPLGLGNGSCNDDAKGASCAQWSPPVLVPTANAVESVHAAAFRGHLVVAFVDAHEQVWTMSASQMAVSGEPNWASERRVVGARADREPHLVAMPELRRLALFVTFNGTIERYVQTPAGSFVSQGGVDVRNQDGAIVYATESPTLTVWAGRTCGVFTDYGEPLFSCYDARRDRFALVSYVRRDVQIMAKPGLAFHALREPDGTFVANAEFGQFWVTMRELNPTAAATSCPWYSGPGCPRNPMMHVSTTLASGSGFGGFEFPRASRINKPGVHWTPKVGLPLLETPDLGALKGLYVSSNTLRFLPLADGSVDTELRDGSDFRVMERGICLGLQSEAFCGGPFSTVSGM